MSQRLRVVFISRRNSLRSVLAEACLLNLADDKFAVSSAGKPGAVAADIHPAAVGALNSAGIEVPAAPPKSWAVLLRAGAPVADFVITLDDEMAELAPRWPGQPELATWHCPDIAASAHGEETSIAAVRLLYSLRRRLELLASLPLRGSDRNAIRSDVRDLAHMR